VRMGESAAHQGRAHAHDNRGRCSGVSREQQRPFGSTRMDTGRLDAVDGADGAGEFAFERAQVI